MKKLLLLVLTVACILACLSFGATAEGTDPGAADAGAADTGTAGDGAADTGTTDPTASGAGAVQNTSAQETGKISSVKDITLKFFEKVAVFTTLANNELYYAQFRVDREYGWITCRSCNVIESALPTEEEVLTLLYAPLWAMEEYGNGLASICTLGTDPYEAFESCQTSIETA